MRPDIYNPSGFGFTLHDRVARCGRADGTMYPVWYRAWVDTQLEITQVHPTLKDMFGNSITAVTYLHVPAGKAFVFYNTREHHHTMMLNPHISLVTS